MNVKSRRELKQFEQGRRESLSLHRDLTHICKKSGKEVHPIGRCGSAERRILDSEVEIGFYVVGISFIDFKTVT